MFASQKSFSLVKGNQTYSNQFARIKNLRFFYFKTKKFLKKISIKLQIIIDMQLNV